MINVPNTGNYVPLIGENAVYYSTVLILFTYVNMS